MTKPRRIILCIWGLVSTAVVLFPPWVSLSYKSTKRTHAEFAPVWSPEPGVGASIHVDLERLGLLLAAAGFLALVAVALTHSTPPTDAPD